MSDKSSLTWGEFKKLAEEHGVTDEMEITWISISIFLDRGILPSDLRYSIGNKEKGAGFSFIIDQKDRVVRDILAKLFEVSVHDIDFYHDALSKYYEHLLKTDLSTSTMPLEVSKAFYGYLTKLEKFAERLDTHRKRYREAEARVQQQNEASARRAEEKAKAKKLAAKA